jgi:hypothetical protein
MAAGQGAATSLAVTGATVASTVSGGTTLGVALGAVVVDITSVMVGMGRIVALSRRTTDTTCASRRSKSSRRVC